MRAIKNKFNPLIRLIKSHFPQIFFGIMLILPFFPSFVIYIMGQDINFAFYGLPIYLVAGFVFYLLLAESLAYVKISQLISYSFMMAMGLWLYIVGFYSLSIYFSIGALILYSGLSQKKADGLKILCHFTLLFLILTPLLVNNPLIQYLRFLSMQGVDAILNIISIPFQREGTMYLVANLNIEIWEKCSGYSTARAFFILFSFIFLIQNRPLGFFFLSPLLAFSLGLITNILRIVIHLYFSIKNGEPLSPGLHEMIGTLLLIFFASIAIFFLLRNKKAIPLSVHSWEKFKFPGKIPLMIFIFIILSSLVAQSLIFKKRVEKKIEHQYSESLSHHFNKDHNNSFCEWAGKGVWLLFEYPVEYCYQYFGWKKEDSGNLFQRRNESVKIKTVYEIAGKRFENRFHAIAYKILRIDQYDEPVKAMITVTEVHPVFKFLK